MVTVSGIWSSSWDILGGMGLILGHPQGTGLILGCPGGMGLIMGCRAGYFGLAQDLLLDVRGGDKGGEKEGSRWFVAASPLLGCS